MWKYTNLEVHRMHLKLAKSLNEMLKQARSMYFSDLVNLNKRNPKVVFECIQNIVLPSTPLVPVYTIDDCNIFLKYFVNKVNEIRASIKPSDKRTTVVASSNCSWATFSAVSLDEGMVLPKKRKPF